MIRPMPLLDLAFLWLDRPETPSNVGVLMLFDPPPGRSAAAAANRVVRAYRATRPGHPFDCVPDLSVPPLPHWRRVEQVDMRQHVLRERLEAPGDVAGLCRHVARLHATPLDRSRPLFGVHVIEGLASGQLALYVKSHHSSWDGRYALERIFGRLAQQPGPIVAPFFAPGPEPAAPAEPGSPPDKVAHSIRSLMTQALAAKELVAKLSARARDGATAELPHGNHPFAGPPTRFNDPIGPGRSYACFSLPLPALRALARAGGGTVNDVALAVVDAGLERYLASLGERPRQALVSMCPVSLREPGDHEATTKAATLFVRLARPRSGAADRLRQIIANTREAKTEFRGFSREAALDYALLAFGLWFASSTLGLGAITRPVVNLVVSNVGAATGPRYLGDCRLAAAYPVSMIADPAGLNFTLVTVDDHVDFGIVANAAVMADASPLARECEAAFARLQRLTLRKPPVRSPSRTRRMPPSQRS